MKIRDRIKELRRVKASDLVPSVRNWRNHTEAQRSALRGVLSEIGYADALLARELEDGRLELIDGHLRAEETPDLEVPVLVLDVSEEEAALILATHDPIGAMAESNAGALEDLLGTTQADDADVRELLDDLARGLDAEEAAKPAREKTTVEEAETVREMYLRPHEHYDYVIVLARSTQEWNQLADRIGLEQLPKPREKGRLGWARGISATRLIELMDAKPEPEPEPKPKRRRKKRA